MNKPHVIIIMADQLRVDALGGHTPNINHLKQDSFVFERVYCASPICVPARGAFFTGKYPNVTGCVINPWEQLEERHGLVRSGTANLYQMMEQEWDSWQAGKQGFLSEDRIDESENCATHWLAKSGYSEWLKENGKKKPSGGKGIVPEMAFGTTTRLKRYSTPDIGLYEEGVEYCQDWYIARQSVDAIRNRNRDKPMLLNAMFVAPHPPLVVPEPYYSRVTEVDLPINVGRWSEDQSPLQLYNLTGAIGTRYSREDWRQIWPVYLGLVSMLDDCVGKIIDELKSQNLYDDSLILFTSDHGEMLGSHCLWQKMCMYEESARVPLFMKFPASDRVIGGSRSDELVSGVDVFPTLCDYLGLATPADVSGLSLMPVVRGGSLERDTIFIQFDGNGARGNFQRCIVQEKNKLIVDMFKDELYLELYDLGQDPQELVNLAFEASREQMISELLEALRSHMKHTRDMLEIPVNAYSEFMRNYFPFRSEAKPK
jgi:arylsulfatase A-like enzyme